MRESRFFQNCGNFCFDLYWKYHNFERIMILATVLLKWTNFKGSFSFMCKKSILSLCIISKLALLDKNFIFTFLNRSTMMWWVICHACPVDVQEGDLGSDTIFFCQTDRVLLFFSCENTRDFLMAPKAFKS